MPKNNVIVLDSYFNLTFFFRSQFHAIDFFLKQAVLSFGALTLLIWLCSLQKSSKKLPDMCRVGCSTVLTHSLLLLMLLQAPHPAGQLVAEAASVAAYPRQARKRLRGGEHLNRGSWRRRRCQPGRLICHSLVRPSSPSACFLPHSLCSVCVNTQLFPVATAHQLRLSYSDDAKSWKQCNNIVSYDFTIRSTCDYI